MELRPYQTEAVNRVMESWRDGVQKTLLLLPTGTGKTVVFCSIGDRILRSGGKLLILAHRAELLDQAADKFEAVTGLRPELEKAEQTTVGYLMLPPHSADFLIFAKVLSDDPSSTNTISKAIGICMEDTADKNGAMQGSSL